MNELKSYTQPVIVGTVAIIILITIKKLLISSPECSEFICFFGGGLFGAATALFLIMIATEMRIVNE